MVKNSKIKDFKVDFLGIGAEKAATYWVAAILRDHPEVCFSLAKELHFFSEYDPHYLKVRNLKYQRGINWYKKQFAHCTKRKIKGEYTPTYMYCQKAAKRIKKHFPQVKLITCLRDPVKRAFSQYLHDKSIGLIKKMSFEQALTKHNSYVEKSLYYKHLKHYFKLFPQKNILVLFVDEIKKDPQKVATKVYKFLNLRNIDFKPPSLKKRFNQASESRFWLLNYFLIQTEYFLKRNQLSWILQILEDSGIRKSLFLFSYYPNRKPLANYPQIAPQTEKRLRKIFEKDVEKLEKLLHKNLNSWKPISQKKGRRNNK